MKQPLRPKLISLPKIDDPRGNLTFFENESQINFSIQRIFFTYDVPAQQRRGGHAYHQQNELIVALSGSFDVVITYPEGSQKKFSLNRPHSGLYIPAKIWRHLENFSTNAVSLHASDLSFDDNDYIRDFKHYVECSGHDGL